MSMALTYKASPRAARSASLIERARRGDEAARAALLRKLQDPWYRFTMAMLGDVEDARDATQETALRFCRRLTAFRGDSELTTWAFGIAVNVCRETLRRRARKPDGDRIAAMRRSPPEPPAQAGDNEQAVRLRDLVGQLPPRQREAIVLRYFEQLTLADTADVMQCAVGTVKATVAQALRNIRKQWSDAR
jgi:RNA polymerase sigma-70 factor (ECF subfamily)